MYLCVCAFQIFFGYVADSVFCVKYHLRAWEPKGMLIPITYAQLEILCVPGMLAIDFLIPGLYSYSEYIQHIPPYAISIYPTFLL